MKDHSVEDGEKFSRYREMMYDLLNDMTVSGAVSLLTMAMAEYIIRMTESEKQYHQAVDKASDFLHALPPILKLLMDEENSVKH